VWRKLAFQTGFAIALKKIEAEKHLVFVKNGQSPSPASGLTGGGKEGILERLIK
jgi:hypothetical protein